MRTQTLLDGTEPFKVSVCEGSRASPVVLFAVGAGGQPERHATLLGELAGSGCTVVAPHFERLPSPFPTDADLALRARRLTLALDAFVPPDAAAVGAGHSIGAATLLALAGGQMRLGPGRRVDIAADRRLTRLALLATPTGFFQAPGALDAVRVPILAWVGTADGITPPIQTERLAQALREGPAVHLRVTSGAGHFSFMDVPPPQTVEPLPDKPAFLREHSREVCRFLVGPPVVAADPVHRSPSSDLLPPHQR